jgi:hypothetical protein
MAENNTNRTVMLLAGAVVVLLIAFVVVVVLSTNSGGGQSAQTSNNTAATTTASTDTSATGLVSSTSTPFDPSTATKVPAGQTPQAFVSAYYQDMLDGKWADAFKMQPYASQQGQTVADFQATETSYGMTSFKLIGEKTVGTTATVVIEQNLGANGIWGATWTLVKQGGTWLVKSRSVSMGTPTAP